MDDSAPASTNNCEEKHIKSFGFSIDTNAIECISKNEQSSDIQNLNVKAYEQETFESGIINQVDSALEHVEKNIRIKIVEKDIESATEEITNVTAEIDSIDDIFKRADQGDDAAKITFSLLQTKKTKERRLKELQTELEKLYNTLNFLNQTTVEDSAVISENNISTSVDLGEITPFDALKLKNSAQPSKIDPLINTKSDEDGDKFLNEPQEASISINIFPQEQESESNDFEEEISPQKRKRTNSDDEEYIPDELRFDDDEQSDEQSDEIVEDLQIKKTKTKPAKVAKTKVARKRVKDDGDFNLFRERMRKLKVRERLKAACKAGEVIEEFNEANFSEDEEEKVEVEDGFCLPHKIWGKLYKYQRVGVKWLWQLHSQQVGGIVGDEMGLGKTIQVIAFLAGLQYSKRINTDNKKFSLGATLIACPGTVLYQWVGEFHKWWPHFRVAILHDSGTFTGSPLTLIRAIHKHPGILVTTYAGFRKYQQELLKHNWHYVILDEGHKIRNPDAKVTWTCKKFDTSHRLILTGTPMQNSLKELWSLFDFVYPGRLGTLPVFLTEFSIPITMGGYANASNVQVQTAYKCSCVLKDTIAPYMIRRLKKDVQKAIQLPRKNEQILFCKLTEEQKKTYTDYLNSRDVASIMSGDMKIFPGLIKLRKICNHPDLVLDTSDKAGDVLTDEQCHGYWKRSGKMVVVENLLRMWKLQNHRVLLFSQSTKMLDIMERFVNSVGYKYLRMDGTTNIKSRQGLVENFNEDTSIFVFLLTTRVGGLGLNLIGANRVVIFDPDWNPSTDSQARERSWRIGQQKDVTIYRLLTTGTIEEKIYHRQIFKQFLTNRVLSNPFQRRFFKSNDLYELFTLGDIGPQQITETGAIFAGTGSEIKLRKKVKPESISVVSKPRIVDSKKKSERKKRKTKKKVDVKVDGFNVENIDKKEVLRIKEEVSKSNDDDILLSLFKSSGIHSAMKHDKIEQSDTRDYMLVEKEAERVAKKAANALRESRAQCRKNGISQPTWTGVKKKPRFGSKSTITTTASTQNNGVVKSQNNVDVSSSALLARLKNRNTTTVATERDETNNTVQQSEDLLLKDVQCFMAQRFDFKATTDEIVGEFKSRIKEGENALFKQLLKQVCDFQKQPDGVGIWTLKDDFK